MRDVLSRFAGTGDGRVRFPSTSAERAVARELPMGNLLYWAVVLLIIALVAAAFGFGGIAGTASSLATTLFYIFIVLFVVALILGVMRRGRV